MNKKKIIVYVIACVLVFGLGFLTYYISSVMPKQAKEFDMGADFKLTLTKEFKEEKDTTSDYALLSKKVGVNFDYTTFVNLEENGYVTSVFSIEDFAKNYACINDLGKLPSVDEERGLVYIVYNESEGGERYTCVDFFYRGDKAFYDCQFYCYSENYSDLKNQIFDWAATAKYTKEIANQATAQEFISAMDFKVTLTNEFTNPIDGTTQFGAENNCGQSLLAEKLLFAGYEDVDVSALDEEGFAQTLITSLDLNTQVQKDSENNLTYFEYSYYTNDNIDYFARTYVMKGENAFYTFEFSCFELAKATDSLKFTDWAKTITFVNN